MTMTDRKPAFFKIVVKGIVFFILIIAFLFVVAGRVDYWQGWLFGGITLGFFVLTVVLLRHSYELALERQRPGPGMKTWDKAYLAISSLMGFVALVLAGLDAGRYGWSGPLPAWLYGLSIGLYAVGQAVFIWAKVANRFFSSVVRIQTERGHVVCEQGPYRFVRHPGYVGGILYGVTTPLLLGSDWAVIPQAVAVLTLLVRTELEDRLLQRELQGYRDYAGKVRFRLIPGVW
jgi:protein-S-isoprenylcysteine O-methyltransferase Ste14